jgi:hypothetical protein
MRTMKMGRRSVLAGVALAGGLLLAGCGTPGAPMPPSLNLPQPVADLAAVRSGDQVSLTWSMPKKNTDKLFLKDNVAVRVCRGSCNATNAELSFAPGANGTYTDTLPASFNAGAPRPLSYFVELKNRSGRSAGLSNAAVVLAGAAPAPVAGLTAEVRKAGVILHWTPADAAESSTVRLHRTLLTPPPAKHQEGLLAPQPEPVNRNLLVGACAAGARECRALDKEIRFGESYEYRAQRIARVETGGKTLELAGPVSAPVRINVVDIFPPDVPTGLAAVASVGEEGAETAIDLSWQPVTDVDLAGYIVYRREGDGGWRRISPVEPLVPPAFHDTGVQPGRIYHYAVSAIDQGRHESVRSRETEESVPER